MLVWRGGWAVPEAARAKIEMFIQKAYLENCCLVQCCVRYLCPDVLACSQRANELRLWL